MNTNESSWKPSEGQLECLEYAINNAEKDYSPLAGNRIYLTLKALKKQLEKIKNETIVMEDYKKKYKDAIERAKKWYNAPNADKIPTYANRILAEIFPELAESEDERIRKSLLNEFIHLQSKGYKFAGLESKDIIAWLEKQGEKKTAVTDFKAKDWYVSKVDGKIHDMTYNPADKVEPKFKVGDWVVLTAGELSTTLQIVNVDVNKKLYWFNDSSYLPVVDEECLHHWTIQDAKDGDVLACCDNKPFIFKGFFDLNFPNCLAAYCGVTLENQFGHCNGKTFWTNQDVKPATKKQCNLLFQKMHEAGYEWDAKKKELKLLISNGGDFEPELSHQEVTNKSDKVRWSEKDQEFFSLLEGYLELDYDLSLNDKANTMDWLKSIKERLK